MTILKFIGQLVTWLTVIVGWIVVADQQSYRELRKDRAARLNDIRKALTEAEELAISFHTAEAYVRKDALAMRRKLLAIGRELTVLGDCNFVDKQASEAMLDLREACSGFNDSPATFVQQDHFSDAIGKIMSSRDELDDILVASLTQAILSNKTIVHSLRDLIVNGKAHAVSIVERYKLWRTRQLEYHDQVESEED